MNRVRLDQDINSLITDYPNSIGKYLQNNFLIEYVHKICQTIIKEGDIKPIINQMFQNIEANDAGPPDSMIVYGDTANFISRIQRCINAIMNNILGKNDQHLNIDLYIGFYRINSGSIDSLPQEDYIASYVFGSR